VITRKLGPLGIEVSAVALGCWGLCEDPMWGATEERDAIATVRAALDCGITLFDTAEAYGAGQSEERLGKALAGVRDRAIIASKVSAKNCTPQLLARACEDSLARLRTDVIDLYQVHWPLASASALAAAVDTLQGLRDQGKIRMIGVCNFGPANLAEMQDPSILVSDQLSYSLLWRALEFEIAPRCRELGLGILTYSTLLHGLLNGRYRDADEFPPERARTRHFASRRPQTRHGESGHEELTFATIRRLQALCDEAGVALAQAALAWAVRRPGVTSVLAGARNPGQVAEDAAAGTRELPAGLLDSLTNATDDLKVALGPNPDMWQSPGRTR
jgi:myo-inositol catabolism protein IolS